MPAVINRDILINGGRDFILLSTNNRHTTLAMLQFQEETVPRLTQYDGFYSESEMDPKLLGARQGREMVEKPEEFQSESSIINHCTAMYTTIGDSWMSPFKIVYHFGPERSQNLNQQ
jgi:hypothetical protein